MEPGENIFKQPLEKNSPKNSEVIEFVPHFKILQEDLLYLFNIQVTSPVSLNYEWVKKEFLEKVKEELKLGTPFALDYMFEEKLLTKKDLHILKSEELRPYIETIIRTYRGMRLERAKNLFIDTGIYTKEEIDTLLLQF